MSIQELSDKFKAFLGNDTIFNALLIVLVAMASFGLGRQSGLANPAEKTAQTSYVQTEAATPLDEQELPKNDTLYVASVNSDKYHLPWCSGAKNISEANKVYFASKSEAEAAGYQPAANCDGL